MLRAALIALALLPLPAAAQDTAYMTITGTGHAIAAEETIHIRSTFSASDTRPTRAIKVIEQQAAKIKKTAAPFGTITTSRLSIRPELSRTKRLIGSEEQEFTIQQSLTLTLSDADKVGPALDALSLEPGSLSLRYAATNRKALLRQAREEAVADALDKAQTYAAAAGLQLGAIGTLTDTSSSSGPHGKENFNYSSSSYGGKAASNKEPLAVTSSVKIRWILQ